ncbi:rhodanese-like domain-containing protein [Flavivirga spongiicola]|uniref:Rhodanese-like domain-containing protein n=1 Tax=Flavivirga spongiicola TaxID=421621 RepID=A0ABU7XW66_9FLAO|nr:rhodanese-like domain-containing protein [Flavivirga sp. MEBiC05379]MDO5980019.1 rhodanese-like domain-containing protein [Flavivirga sp. MEBiC05379]
MKRLIIFLCSIFSISATSCKESSSKGVVKVVSPKMVQTLLIENSIQLLDVRTPKEFKEGHIDGAQNIDWFSTTFDSDIKNLDKTKPVILYCKSGGRSAKSGKKLLRAGFTEIYDLEGGITRWKKAGFEIKF